MSADDIFYIIEGPGSQFKVYQAFCSALEDIESHDDLLKYLRAKQLLWSGRSLRKAIKFAQGEGSEYGFQVIWRDP